MQKPDWKISPSRPVIFRIMLCLLLVALLVYAAIAGINDLLERRALNAPTLLSCISVLALILTCLLFESKKSSKSTVRNDVLYWVAVLVLAFIYRFLPIILDQIPGGLAWEEHETAFGGKQMIANGKGSLMFSISVHIIALFFYLFGVGEEVFRWAAATQGFFAIFLFAGCCRLLFPSAVAFFCIAAYASTPSVFGSSLLGDEGFAILQFISCGALLSLALLFKAPSLTAFLSSGFFLSIAMYEYAPIKPVIPLILIGLLAASVIYKGKRLYLIGGICIFFLTFLFVAGPMVISIIGGGSEFSDGKKIKLPEDQIYIREQLNTLYVGLKSHVYMIFVKGVGGQPLMNDGKQPGFPIWQTFLLFFLPLIFIRKKDSEKRPQLSYLFILFVWCGVSLVGAALYHPLDPALHRMQAMFPVLIIIGGYVLENFFTFISDRLSLVISVSAALVVLVLNSLQVSSNLHNPETMIWFRSRTAPLCEFFQKNPDKTYLLTWDWNWYGRYLGDTDPRVWAENITRNGYDSWYCLKEEKVIARMHFLNMPVSEQVTSVKETDYLIVGTRFPTDDTAMDGIGKTMLQDKLKTYLTRLQENKIIHTSNCEILVKDNWHAYAVCKVQKI